MSFVRLIRVLCGLLLIGLLKGGVVSDYQFLIEIRR